MGLSLAVLLAQKNAVTAVTTTPAKAELINSGISPIQDEEISRFLAEKAQPAGFYGQGSGLPGRGAYNNRNAHGL